MTPDIDSFLRTLNPKFDNHTKHEDINDIQEYIHYKYDCSVWSMAWSQVYNYVARKYTKTHGALNDIQSYIYASKTYYEYTLYKQRFDLK
jgi:hypothetical protein